MPVFTLVPFSLSGLMLIVCLLIPGPSIGAEETLLSQSSNDELIIETVSKAVKESRFSRKGADGCQKCHDQASDRDATAIFSTVHGRRDVEFNDLQCEACHGPGKDHSKSRLRKGEIRAPVIAFGLDSPIDTDQQNHRCLSCHQDDKGKHWPGSGHERNDISCASCHRIHQEKNRVMEKENQTAICQGCHQKTANEFHFRSAHPVRNGQMGCTDCHDTHDSLSEDSLIKNTLNDTCFTCHADKRGPYLWEHAPVTEDCSNCHKAHGSINDSLLTIRTPQLCQQCHSQINHPSFAYQGTGTTRISGFVAGKSCLNCHNQVHGSNHPSGNLLQR